MPAAKAIAFAVSKLSPVTILTLMPALWHFLTESTISGLKGSYNPQMATKVKPASITSLSFSAAKSLFCYFNCLNCSYEKS